jgi:DNA-binding transcriptional ArsR family regulator
MAGFEVDIAPVAALMADRARAAMLVALLGGRALAAGELARVAGVSAPTASAHLGRLLDGGLVTVVRQGRHRYYRLAGPQPAEVIEALGRISPRTQVTSLRQCRQAERLRRARSCYDHLAGEAGVALYDALAGGGLVEADPFGTTEKGEERLAELGIDTGALRKARRRFAAECLDWTERRPHLSGALGAALLARFLELDWLERGAGRELRVTPAGRGGLADSFGCLL